MDHVEAKTYEVLLSFPNMTHPNKVELLDSSNAVVFTTATAAASSGAGLLINQNIAQGMIYDSECTKG